MESKIQIFTTGGTIDGYEYSSTDKAQKEHASFIPKVLENSRVGADYKFEEVFRKDSRFITTEDRQDLWVKCQHCDSRRIVITHGTETMVDTAKFLNKNTIGKTIVLTGSAYPSNSTNSDAIFNLGAAIAAAQSLPNGVFIVMNGKIFEPNNVKKVKETGFFEELRDWD